MSDIYEQLRVYIDAKLPVPDELREQADKLSIYEKIELSIKHRDPVPEIFEESTKLLDKWVLALDRDKIYSEILLCCSNRTAGKTYYCGRLLLDLFITFGVQFAIYTRSGVDLGCVAEGIFGVAINEFEGYSVKEVVTLKNAYSTISISYKTLDENGQCAPVSMEAGYVLSMRADSKIKTNSSKFNKVGIMFMDEFQADEYIPRECEKWHNIHVSVARGGGKASRFVPVLMASNSISIINPYFKYLHLQDKIQDDTKIYHGVGLTLLRFVNEEVKKAQSESRFNMACGDSQLMKSNIENEWLRDCRSCVCKPSNDWGKSTYICTFTCGNDVFGLRQYDNGLYYVNRSPDWSCPYTYALSVEGVENIECAKRAVPLNVLAREFLRGRARFSDLSCKSIFMEWI